MRQSVLLVLDDGSEFKYSVRQQICGDGASYAINVAYQQNRLAELGACTTKWAAYAAP